jgi:hypothetical protein
MIAAAAGRFASRSVSPNRALVGMDPQHERARSRPLDSGVERGYERLLIKDMTMASCFTGLRAMTLDTIRAERTTARRPTVFAKQAVA